MSVLNGLPVPFDRMAVRACGAKMCAPTFDRFVALWCWKLGLLERSEHELLGRLCRPGMRAVDIGANIGFHALTMAGGVGPSGSLLAFEPEPRVAGCLEANLERNGFEWARVIRAAVAEQSGETTLWVSAANRGDSSCCHAAGDGRDVSMTVPRVALDDVVEKGTSVDVLKMDVQGGEVSALKGMPRVLAESPRLNMLIELWPQGLEDAGSSTHEALGLLKEHGLALAALLPGGRVGSDWLDLDALEAETRRRGYINLLARGPEAPGCDDDV